MFSVSLKVVHTHTFDVFRSLGGLELELEETISKMDNWLLGDFDRWCCDAL